ncbi:MAG: hypothetical protein O3B13_13530 [Planctomycetota bacterium]|nr:hypothetical protein [Planctomycetota bacterium]
MQHSGLESAEICELDADGPLLDSTMALYGSGMAFGHSHGSANLPLTLACGGGLGIRHGRHVDFNAQSKAEGYTYDLDNHAKHDAICHSRLVTLRAKVRRS